MYSTLLVCIEISSSRKEEEILQKRHYRYFKATISQLKLGNSDQQLLINLITHYYIDLLSTIITFQISISFLWNNFSAATPNLIFKYDLRKKFLKSYMIYYY